MQTLFEAVFTFLGTNIDELFILVTLYLELGNNLKKREIITGQYLGLSFLILVSFIGSLGTILIPEKYIPLLGIVPIFFGIKELLEYLRSKKTDPDEESIAFYDQQSTTSERISRITLIFIASGADNISLYLSLFAQQTYRESLVTIIVFLVLLPIWSRLAQSFSNLPILENTIHKYKDVLVPIIFIALGIHILFG